MNKTAIEVAIDTITRHQYVPINLIDMNHGRGTLDQLVALGMAEIVVKPGGRSARATSAAYLERYRQLAAE